MIPIAHAQVRVEVVNLHHDGYYDDDDDVDIDDDDDVDDDHGVDDDVDVDQHASALVCELGPLHCAQTPLVLIIMIIIITLKSSI